jgi:hypothetical protein
MPYIFNIDAKPTENTPFRPLADRFSPCYLPECLRRKPRLCYGLAVQSR